jgi:fatty-acyl-CoA synthase
MKIAFSTLGCPEWPWSEVISAAKDLGYHGIELRNIESQMDLTKAKPLLGEELERTKAHLDQIGLAVSCLSSASRLNEQDLAASIAEGEAYIDLAAKLGSPFVRVLGDTDPAPGNKPVPREQVIEGLQVLGKSARAKGITVLVETNGALADSTFLADLLAKVNEPGVAVLWDIHHPYRFFGEAPAETVVRLGEAIRYIHIKDSRQVNGGIRYCMLGEGDLPVRECLSALLDEGYHGWLSLEWVKKWNPDIEEPGIVFPHFIATIQRYLKEIYE